MRLPNQSPGLLKSMLGTAWNKSTGITPLQGIQFLPSAALPKSFWLCYWSCLFTGGNDVHCFSGCLPIKWFSFRP
jgi:hypothetical protein